VVQAPRCLAPSPDVAVARARSDAPGVPASGR
jgi:hypothetical protein